MEQQDSNPNQNSSGEYPAKRPRGRPRKIHDVPTPTEFYDPTTGQTRRVYIAEQKPKDKLGYYEWEGEVKVHVLIPISFSRFVRQADLPKDAFYLFIWLWERIENGNSVPLPGLREIGELCAPEGTPYDKGRVSRILDLLEDRNLIVRHPMSDKTLRINPKLCYLGKSPNQRASVKEYDKFRAARMRQKIKEAEHEGRARLA